MMKKKKNLKKKTKLPKYYLLLSQNQGIQLKLYRTHSF